MKTYKIYLNIYDFMGANGCLEAIGLGAYHTGIEIGYFWSHEAMMNTAIVLFPQIQMRREW